MVICEFCIYSTESQGCRLGLKTPKRPACREFEPGIDHFCSDPSDFVNPAQIHQMATFFGIKGSELRKITTMANREHEARLKRAEVPDGAFDGATQSQTSE
ncbi:MAG: hypothetical protein DMF61_05555 [Blastocatellia bacterium AA13]|nr:MAG: hypothetical protein DMF61_05555 [Blastocatellia bacterium AA13]